MAESIESILIHNGKEIYRLDPEHALYHLGRGQDVEISLDGTAMSRQHARLEWLAAKTGKSLIAAHVMAPS